MPFGERLMCRLLTLLENLVYQLLKTFPVNAGGVLGGEGDGEELCLKEEISSENLLNIFKYKRTDTHLFSVWRTFGT